MVSIFKKIGLKITTKNTPGKGAVAIICGILNFFLFGVGTIIAGCLDKDKVDILIGVIQLLLPLVGWIWSIIWGILMIIHGL